MSGSDTSRNGSDTGLSGSDTGLSGSNIGLSGSDTGLSGSNTGLSGSDTGLSGSNTGLSGSNLAQVWAIFYDLAQYGITRHNILCSYILAATYGALKSAHLPQIPCRKCMQSIVTVATSMFQ